jgi:hypothetical protein
MIETLKGFSPDTIAIKGSGFVSGADYDTVLVPAVERTLKQYDRVRVYYEIAPDFTGISLSAMWKDFWVGVRHITRWKRIAVVSDVPWIRRLGRTFGFILPSATKVFTVADATEARRWLESAP